jgi:hypothetical protein
VICLAASFVGWQVVRADSIILKLAFTISNGLNAFLRDAEDKSLIWGGIRRIGDLLQEQEES